MKKLLILLLVLASTAALAQSIPQQQTTNAVSSTVPVYSFVGSTGTGVGNPASNVQDWIVNGSEVGRIGTSGGMEWGTTLPTGGDKGAGTHNVSGGYYVQGNPTGAVLLNTLTASNSATLSDTTSLTSTYSKYLIVFENIVSVTNNVGFTMQVSTNGGSSYLNSSYVSGCSFTVGTINTWSGGSLTTGIGIVATNSTYGVGNVANYGLNGNGIFYNPAGTGGRHFFAGEVTFIDNSTVSTGTLAFGKFTGFQDGGNTAINAIQFSMTSGNISSGKIYIYGIP